MLPTSSVRRWAGSQPTVVHRIAGRLLPPPRGHPRPMRKVDELNARDSRPATGFRDPLTACRSVPSRLPVFPGRHRAYRFRAASHGVGSPAARSSVLRRSRRACSRRRSALRSWVRAQDAARRAFRCSLVQRLGRCFLSFSFLATRTPPAAALRYAVLRLVEPHGPHLPDASACASGRQDLNLRPPRPERGDLPN